MDRQLLEKAASIMKNASVANIAAIDGSGYPRASTISNIKTDGVKNVWFATGLQTGKVKCFTRNNKASVCYHESGDNITLMGTIEIITDAELKKRLWLDWFIDHFPGGVTDPDYCILKFTAEQAVFWIDCKYEEADISGSTM